jgi:serine/threonine-protein kinase HipA
MNDYVLHLFVGQTFVGALVFDPESEAFSFDYAPEWVSKPNGFALSPHLPLTGGATSGAIRRFIENLLPEGRALDVASRHSNITKNNIFGLIRHLGRETAGALSFLPVGQTPQALPPERREVTRAELQQRIDTRNQVPFTVWDGKVRISVAGFQDKLLLLMDGEKMFLADGALASTHILKPEPLHSATPCMVANEHFCMRLVNRISQRRYGQDHAAAVEILRVPSPVLLVERFDRRKVADGVQRIHVIDATQALDMPLSAKYERNFGNGKDVRHIRDGVSFARLMSTRQHLEQPAIGMQRLVLWAATTLLLGNSDAHGKNISFYLRKAGLSVAPLYDLVSVVQYDAEQYEHDLAMAFGDAFTLSDIRAYALADFCLRTGIARTYFARELTTLCKLAIEEATTQALDPAYQDEEVVFVQKIAAFVIERAHALLKMAPEIPKFKKEQF